MESLDLVSSSGEEARTWITGLKYLMAGISDEDSLAKRQRTRDQYPFYTAWKSISQWWGTISSIMIHLSICFTKNKLYTQSFQVVSVAVPVSRDWSAWRGVVWEREWTEKGDRARIDWNMYGYIPSSFAPCGRLSLLFGCTRQNTMQCFNLLRNQSCVQRSS